jgi:plastocyanin
MILFLLARLSGMGTVISVHGLSRLLVRAIGVCGLLSMVIFPVSAQFHLWASSPHIHIQSDPPFFSPNQLTVFSNFPLTWENRTHEPHSIVADDCQSRSVCSFDSGIIRPDHQFVLPSLTPGLHPYHCGLHPFMRGMVIIHHPSSSPSSDI